MLFSKNLNAVSVSKKVDYYRLEMGNEFPIKRYITEMYGYAPCSYSIETDFNCNILDFLTQNR